MTEGNQKDKGNTSEKNTETFDEVNVPQDREQEKNVENAETPDGDNLEATAAGEPADTQNLRKEGKSNTSPIEDNTPREMQAI
jgi:hypothetical protein